MTEGERRAFLDGFQEGSTEIVIEVSRSLGINPKPWTELDAAIARRALAGYESRGEVPRRIEEKNGPGTLRCLRWLKPW